MHPMLRKAAIAVVSVLCTSTLLGQVATGTYNYGTFDTLGFDTVNVGNLDVHFAIPVLNKIGRGIPFSYALTYDSSVWEPETVSGVQQWQPVAGWGWNTNSTPLAGYMTAHVITTPWGDGPSCSGTETIWTGYVYYDSLGKAHPFNGSSTLFPSCASGGPGPFPTGSQLATDGSGFTMNATEANWTVTYPSSSVVTGAGLGQSSVVTYMDSNGNEVTVNSSGQFTDTTGNIVLTSTGTAPSPLTLTYTDTTGTSRHVLVNYETYTVETYFHDGVHAEYGPLSTSLVSSIGFPDGSSYSFTYEETPTAGSCAPLSGTYSTNCVTGRIASITLPAGGIITYTYTGGSNGIESDGSTAGLERSLTSNSGSAASTWTYTRTIGTGTSTTAVVDGLGNNKTYTFVEASNQPSGTTAEYYETSRSVYQGAASGTAVVARNTCYNAAASPCATTIPTLPFSQIDTYETLNGLETHGATAMFNTYGMQTEAEVWDFGTTSRGSLLRKELWTYGYSIANLPTEDEVFDGSGNVAGKTLYTYDGTTPTASTNCAPGTTGPSCVPQHVAISGPRGNLTSETVYASASTSYAMSATYQDTGSLLTSVTPNGTTTLGYDTTFVYNTGAALPTPSSGVAIGTGQTYDNNYTGLPLNSTDPNTQVTKITSYDPLLRPLEVQFPDGGETTWTYTPTSVLTSTLQTTSVSSNSEVQYDGYSRQSRTEVANGQSSNPYYQLDTCYDANGNASFSSYPYQGTGFGEAKVCSGSGDTYTYDVLGRVTTLVRADGETRSYTYSGRDVESVDENGVTRISQVDGLGRTTIVCEVSPLGTMLGTASPVACGTNMDIAGTGYETTYSYALATGTTTITQGSQTRTFVSDWLGRPTSVTEPESGTTTYSYAYNSTGLVVTRQRPQANQTNSSTLTTTTTQYDALNRIIGVSYSDGTASKLFVYDASVNWLNPTVPQANVKGRLSEIFAYIPPNTPPAGVGSSFGYDAMGRINSLGECVPSNCGNGNYAQSFTYDLAGDMTSSTDGAGVTSTYAVSVAHELSSLTSSLSNSTNPANIISSVQNGPNGPNTYNLGNGLTGVREYDSLGRIFGQWICNGSTSTACTGGTQMYGFAVGWTGILAGWDCDTVQDQCASNGYDGFNRLTSRSIYTGTTQNYTYGYDRYGNRWNETPLNGGYTSSLSFYAATNKIITAGFAYDAAGNLTNDTFHTYTYDAEGNVTAVDGGSTAKYVYNALNQRVQTVVGSVNTESVFNLAGQRVSVWNGTTGAQIEGKYYWGAKPVAYYEAWGAVSFEHQNWQGTERMRTTYNGGVEGTYTSQPFGDGLTTTSGSDTDAYHYAMVDHDYQSDTEHAQFRQYSNAQGRWMAPDPYYGSYDFSNPQSMNRYAYALNSPLSNIDPSGLYCRWDEGPDDDDPTDGGATYDDCIAQGGSWMDTTSVTVYGGASNDPGITMENGQQIYPTIAGAPNNGPAKPPLTPQQKHDMICQALDNITKGAASTSDVILAFSTGSFIVAGVAAINIEGAPISEPVAAGATVVGAISGIGGLGIKGFQYGNTALARWGMGCSNNPW
jgi:RHS repeat-associated protein